MNLRFIDWIWHIRGSLALAPGQSGDEAFDRLDPLFQKGGTRHERSGDTLTFSKKDQAAQDKMSIFDSGTLTVEPGEAGGAGAVLRYNLKSKALLFCFLAPLLFLSFAGLNMALGELHRPKTEQAKKAAEAKEKAEEEKKKKKAEVPMNPVDKFLGAPEPEKPKDKEKGKDGKEKDKGDDKKPPTTPAFVFAGIFFTLYVVGRILESWLIRSLFRKALAGV